MEIMLGRHVHIPEFGETPLSDQVPMISSLLHQEMVSAHHMILREGVGLEAYTYHTLKQPVGVYRNLNIST